MPKTISDKWIDRWYVESSSGPGVYVIGKDREGNYACSCPGWTMHLYCPNCSTAVKKDHYCGYCRRTVDAIRGDCKHIYTVKTGRAKTMTNLVIDRMLGRL